MSRGTELCLLKQENIKIYRKCCKTIHQIVSILDRNKGIIFNFLKNPENYRIIREQVENQNFFKEMNGR